MTSLLTFHQVSFGYQPDRPVLHNISFNLQAGRIAAILGPNGVGKTTLISLILGAHPVWAGAILLNGRPLASLSPRQRGQRIALVPQSEHTPFDYTVLDYVLMGRAPHLNPLAMPTAADLKIAQASLAQVGIEDLAERHVPRLSGGERQLMLLARALTQLTGRAAGAQPGRLLLLDEPTSHLDLHNKARLIEILRQLRASGVTILMSNHEPDVVLALADDVLLLENDAPPQFGPLEQVFTAQALTRIYQHPIRLAEIDGRRHVLWT